VITRRELLWFLGAGSVSLGARSAFGRSGPARLATRLTRHYGLRHPIVGAGMGFYALPELVAAISNAGALGVLGAAVLPPPALQCLIRQTRALTRQPFGVDLFNAVAFEGTVPLVTDDHIAVCIAEEVKLVVFFWETPRGDWVRRLHAAGAKVWMQVGTVDGALAAVEAGVDALIAQGAESGGHVRGAFEGDPLPRAALVPAILDAVGPRLVLAAGGIADGHQLAGALLAGADGAWVGTRFATARESYAHDAYKRRVVRASAGDTVVTTLFGPELCPATGRALRNRVVDQWSGGVPGLFEEGDCPPAIPGTIGTTLFAGQSYPMPKFSAIIPTRDTVGDIDEMWLPAGSTSTGLIREIRPAAQIIAHMVEEARTALAGR
jgi:enoyl-[acyl-carrier protein] reductase II